MSESFNPPQPNPQDRLTSEDIKKKKLWRNLFFINLCVTLLLVGIFWLPFKLKQLNSFLESSSVNPSKKGNAAVSPAMKSMPAINPNLLAAQSVVVDATSDEEWTYFDFSRGKQVKIHDRTSLEWDMAFRRGTIITNGGATNKFGGAGIMNLGEVSFDAVETVPMKEFVTDTATRTQTENSLLLQWYKYNFITHKLTPRKYIYVFRTADRKYTKIKFLSFYCADKQPGCIQMQYVYQDNGSKSFLKDSSTVASQGAAPTPDI